MRERQGKLTWYEARWPHLEFFGPQWHAFLGAKRGNRKVYKYHPKHFTETRIRRVA